MVIEVTGTRRLAQGQELDLTRIHTVPDPYYHRVLHHASGQEGGETTWDLRSRASRPVASGVYFYHVTIDGGETAVGRLAVVR